MECKDCKYYEGRDWETGEPQCSYEDTCPYEEEGDQTVDESGVVKVEIRLDDMETRIESAFRNSIASKVGICVQNLIKDEFGSQIREKTTAAVEAMITQKVAEYMEQSIQVGGWREEARTVTRNQYIGELIEKKLDDNFDKDKLAKTISNGIDGKIQKFTQETKQEINRSLNDMFDSAMRTNLTDSIVSMLMSNETYQKLNSSMKQLVGGGAK